MQQINISQISSPVFLCNYILVIFGISIHSYDFFLQHANEDVEKMILGNKCDMEDKRQVTRDTGDQVCPIWIIPCILS